ncbi:MAG: hypothetical protein KDK04_25760 [Candidatus Competibacteraceae bacterium]|nr:hypothetical protein [Candidatus Competibacteraceae bacterium]MCB1805245.1 hypothetical protein [Candidatus Competibacteraceae bacterium]MCB1815097.1 hypothetical protein [Candidatus Competibacteraceae bacterium]
MSEQRRRRDWLIVLFVAGLLAFNYPLLGLVNSVALLFGVPVLYFYLFAIWLLLIIGVAVVLWFYRTTTTDETPD